MAGKLTTVGGVILSVGVLLGTAIYVRGSAPAFPYNAWGFNGLFAVCLVYALAFGRR